VSYGRQRVHASCRPANKAEQPLIATGVGDVIAAYYRADGTDSVESSRSAATRNCIRIGNRTLISWVS
jgi:hypothetical protein